MKNETVNDFEPGTLWRHVKSGKLYRVVKFPPDHPTHTHVVGQRNGKNFGPARAIAKDQLVKETL